MSDNDFLERIRGANENYHGKMRSVTFVVKRGNEQKKIFKWFFKPNNIDFYISFPYYHCESYHCGVFERPDASPNGTFNAVRNGTASHVPLKFSYHRDGNIHFKPTSYASNTDNNAYKLASLKVLPITQREGEHVFTILFEGLSKFEDYKKPLRRKGGLEILLPIPDDVINFEIRGYTSSTSEGLDGKVKAGIPPWFQFEGRSPEGEPIYLGIYALLSRKSHIVDINKNGLMVLAGFDRSEKTGKVKSLYLFAR
ncbi:MAG TPA: hypothetical protein VIK81_04590 [Patescibacteria group bacterium]